MSYLLWESFKIIREIRSMSFAPGAVHDNEIVSSCLCHSYMRLVFCVTEKCGVAT